MQESKPILLGRGAGEASAIPPSLDNYLLSASIRECGLRDRGPEFKSKSSTFCLCDLGQVTYTLCALISSSIKWK